MYSSYSIVVSWVVFWLLTIVVIKADDKRAKAKAAEIGGRDFVDRRIKSYVLAAFLFGGFVLVLYFWATRRSKKGGFVGAIALLCVILVTTIVSGIYQRGARSLDYSEGVRACSTLSAEDPDGAKCTRAASQFYEQREEFLKAGCAVDQVESCLYLEGSSSGFVLLGNGEPPEESTMRKKARELCAKRPASVPRGRCSVFDVTH
jgi:hypothetical protein